MILPIGRIPEVVCDYFDKYNSLLTDLRTSPWDLYDENLEPTNEANLNNTFVKTTTDQPWSDAATMPYLTPNVSSFLRDKPHLAELDTEGELLKKKTFSDSVKDLWRTLEVKHPSATTDRESGSVSPCYTSPRRPEQDTTYTTGGSQSNVDRVSDKTQTECHAVWPSQLYPFGPIPNISNHITSGNARQEQEWSRNTENRIDAEWTPREASYPNDWSCLPYHKESVGGHCMYQFDNRPRHVAEQPMVTELPVHPDQR